MYAYTLDTIFDTCSLTQIYRYTCVHLCMSLGTHLATRWGVLTPLDLRVQILELEARGFFRLLIRDAQQKCGSSTDRPKSVPSIPPTRLSSFLFVTHERFMYYS